MHVAVFLDRDGTINEEMGYINHIDRFVLIPGAAAAIRSINESDLKAVIVTNQSGVARGYFSKELIDQVHRKMRGLLEEEGAFLDGIYTCTHAPQRKGESGSCGCRKPKIGLMEQAAQELNLDLEKSYVVGDRFKDAEMARNAGARAILVLTGYGKGELEFLGPSSKVQVDFVAKDLAEAVQWILADAKGQTEKVNGQRKPQRSQRSQKKANVKMAEINRLSIE
jgi:D-glycero-D-manno-heptose 1,7-bisphosphate phosphatase